jgi:hypothetical protein
MRENIVKVIGESLYELLERHSRESQKYTVFDLQEIRAQLNRIIGEYWMTYHGMKFSKKELADMGLTNGYTEEIERLRRDNKVMAALNDSFPGEIIKLERENARLKARLTRTKMELDRLTLAIGEECGLWTILSWEHPVTAKSRPFTKYLVIFVAVKISHGRNLNTWFGATIARRTRQGTGEYLMARYLSTFARWWEYPSTKLRYRAEIGYTNTWKTGIFIGISRRPPYDHPNPTPF